jgi:hypothetical protein
MPQPGIPFAQMGRLETLKAEAMEAMLKIAPIQRRSIETRR